MTVYNIFIKRLTELMKEYNLTAHSLAKKLGIHHNAVDCWLNAKNLPRFDKLKKLSEFFDCSIDYILGLTDDENKKPFSKNPKTFQYRFIELSKHKGISDIKISKACGVAHSSVSRWRHEGTIPDTNALIKLAELFDCSVEYLLGRTD